MLGDLGNRHPLLITLQYLLIARETTLARSGRRRLLMNRAGLFALGEGSRTGMLLPKLQTRVDPTEEAFQYLTPIFDDVPTIHHLFGTWSAFAGSTSVLPGTISTDPLDARMGAKPLREGLCGPIR